MLKSSVFNFTQAALRQTKAGSVREFFRSPTEMLDEVECHLTTVAPGLPSHTPHEHRDEEMVIVEKGEIAVWLNGSENKVGAGSIVFIASGEHHGIRNDTLDAATYYVIRWRTRQ